MELTDILRVLEPVPALTEPLAEWARKLQTGDLENVLRQIRTRADLLIREEATARLGARLLATGNRATWLTESLERLLESWEEPLSMARVADLNASLDALDGIRGTAAWMRAMADILDALGLPTDPSPPAAPSKKAPPATHKKKGEAGSRTLTEEAQRGRVKAIAAGLGSAEFSGGRWGIDFGTARSKLVFRQADDSVLPHAQTTLLRPSVVAVERGGHNICFGEDALRVRGQSNERWNVQTSIKRLLVGKMGDFNGMPARLTTQQLALAFIAWLIHEVDRTTPSGDTPLLANAHMALPVVQSLGQIGDPFPEFHDAKLSYRAWLPRAFRKAQLIAQTYRGEPFPSDFNEFADVSDLWGLQPWNNLGAQKFDVASEPASVLGDFTPASLPDGLILVVDCGAGTTDASVFWHRKDKGDVVCLAERSVILGGDDIDLAIVKLMRDRCEVPEEELGAAHLLARELKPELLSQGRVMFDPADLGLEGLEEVIELANVGSALEAVKSKVSSLISETLQAADKALTEARPRGKRSWLDVRKLTAAWMVGGSSVADAFETGVQSGLSGHGVKIGPTQIDPPTTYTIVGWTKESWRDHAVSAGVSRRDLHSPAWLRPQHDFASMGLTDGDKDA